MSARINVVERLRDAIGAHPVSGQVHRYIEMLIMQNAALEEVLAKRLTSDRLDMYQKLIVNLAPTCVQADMYRNPNISVGRMLDLAQHLAQEATRRTEFEVRGRIDAKLDI